MKHLLSIEKMAAEDMKSVLAASTGMKHARGQHGAEPLKGQTWALIFAKSSTRTRVSFEVGLHELGARPLFLNANDIQLGRGEPVRDTARVLGRMVHGIIIRTYAQREVEEMAALADLPVINALTDAEHPCQLLTDVFTIQERLGSIEGKVVTFVGDGACNVPASWIFAAGKLDFELRIAAPKGYQPDSAVVQRSGGNIVVSDDLKAAARDADVLYADVWVSMGKEAEAQQRLKALTGYQINSDVVAQAKPGVMVMHCLPAYRGKEIDERTFESNADTIFTQAENRLHVQKAILQWIVS